MIFSRARFTFAKHLRIRQNTKLNLVHFNQFSHFENLTAQLLHLLIHFSERYSDVSRFHNFCGSASFPHFYFFQNLLWISDNKHAFQTVSCQANYRTQKIGQISLTLSRLQPRPCFRYQHQLYEIANVIWKQEGNEQGISNSLNKS